MQSGARTRRIPTRHAPLPKRREFAPRSLQRGPPVERIPSVVRDGARGYEVLRLRIGVFNAIAPLRMTTSLASPLPRSAQDDNADALLLPHVVHRIQQILRLAVVVGA